MGVVKKILIVISFFTILSIVLAQSDTTAPVISLISVSNITHESLVIIWTTDKNASSEVEYGRDTNYGSSVTDAILNTPHKITLSGLSGSTTYHYRVKSKDSSGNEAVSNDDKFTTSAAPDTTAPMVGSVSPTAITVDKEVTFSATVSDNVGVKSCLFLKDGTNYTATISAGTVSYKFVSGLPEGSYSIYFECKDEAGNVGKGTSVTVTSSAKQSLQITITLPKTTYYPVENFEPRVTITDASGKSIVDATIKSNITGAKTFYLSFSYSVLCDCYKGYQWFNEGTLAGDYTLYIEASHPNFKTTIASAAFKVVKPTIQTFIVTTDKKEYLPGDSIKLTITIKDSLGNFIKDVSITGEIRDTDTGNLVNTIYPFLVGDVYTYTYYLGSESSGKTYKISVNATWKEQKAAADTTVKIIKPTIQTFTLTTDKKEYLPSDSIILTVTIKDSLGNVIKDARITGEIKEVDTGMPATTIYLRVVGDVYTYTYYLGSESSGKTYKISVNATWKEQKAAADTTVTVPKKGLNADVVIEKNVLRPGENLRGRIKVYDKDGNIIKDAKVEINIQGSQAFKTGYIKYLSTTFKDDSYEIEPWIVEDWVAVGNYTLEIKIQRYTEGIRIEKSIEITKQQLNVDVFLDRTSYKPGDRMYIKILVTYPNGTVAGANDKGGVWVSGEIFPLIAEPFTAATGAETSVGEKEFYQPGLCRIHLSPIPPIYYKGEFIPKYFLDSPYIPTECPTGKYVLRVKVNAPGYAEAEVSKEFDVSLAKLFIETGFSANSQVDSINLAIYAEIKDENGKAIEFASVNGIVRPAEEFKGCIKQFSLYYDSFLKRYLGNQFLSRYECPEGNYLIQVKASSASYEAAEVVQTLVLQYSKGYEYRGVMPATPSESACREVSCGPDCVQRICEPVAPARECYNFVIDDECVNVCKQKLEEVEKEISKEAVDFKECIDKCTVQVSCQGSDVPVVPIELMIEKLNELKKEVAETKEEVSGLKQILLFIIDFVNSILSKYLGQQQAITIPSEVVANATNTTSPITGAFSAVIKTILRQ
jgi:hypothetical protein